MLTHLVYIYLGLAIGYNVLSQICLDLKGKAFAPTEPSYGFQVMTIVLILFAVRDVIPIWAFLPLFALWTASTVRFGVGNHLSGFNPETYLNKFTWGSALGINIFGSLVFIGYILIAIYNLL